MLLGRLRIRGKLALLLIPPLLGMIALTVPVVVGRVQVAERASETAQTARLAGQVGSLIQELQQERLLSIGYLLQATARNRLVLQSAAVTDKIADLRASEPPLPDEVRAALDALPPLAGVRAAVLTANPPTNPLMVLDAFGKEITRLISSLRLSHKADTTTSEGQQILALDAVLRADEGVSARRAVHPDHGGDEEPRARHAVRGDLREPAQGRRLEFRLYATPEQRGLYDLVQKASDARTGAEFLTGFAADPGATLARLDAIVLFPAVESLMTLGRFVEKKIVADVVADVTQRQQRALTEAYVVGALCLLVLLLVLLLSIAVARAVARPLTPPHPSRPTGRPGRRGRARNGSPTTRRTPRRRSASTRSTSAAGTRSATWPARSTGCRAPRPGWWSARSSAGATWRRCSATSAGVRRTWSAASSPLIDRLERQETDPSRLRELYRLDHISSRLRRNASSLVVLSGWRPAPNEHIAPLPLADVVRLALGEIEDYTRVDVRRARGDRRGAGRHRRPDAAARRADGERDLVLPAAHPGHRHRGRVARRRPARASSTTASA